MRLIHCGCPSHQAGLDGRRKRECTCAHRSQRLARPFRQPGDARAAPWPSPSGPVIRRCMQPWLPCTNCTLQDLAAGAALLQSSPLSLRPRRSALCLGRTSAKSASSQPRNMPSRTSSHPNRGGPARRPAAARQPSRPHAVALMGPPALGRSSSSHFSNCDEWMGGHGEGRRKSWLCPIMTQYCSGGPTGVRAKQQPGVTIHARIQIPTRPHAHQLTPLHPNPQTKQTHQRTAPAQHPAKRSPRAPQTGMWRPSRRLPCRAGPPTRPHAQAPPPALPAAPLPAAAAALRRPGARRGRRLH